MVDKTGMGFLAVAVHLQMIGIRDTGSIRLHLRQDSSSCNTIGTAGCLLTSVLSQSTLEILCYDVTCSMWWSLV